MSFFPNFITFFLAVLFCGATLPGGLAYSATLYVDQDNSSGTENGVSWSTAYTDLQDALSAAASDDEIWVAEGTYYPVSASNPTVAQRYISFDLVENVAVYGGFAGTESTLSERDWEEHLTILSGAIGIADDDTDNSFHVLRGAVGASIDGFIVEHGYAKIYPSQTCPEDGSLITVTGGTGSEEILRIVTDIQCIAGGGLYNVHANTVVRNMIFRYNYAAKGGAVYNMAVSEYDFDANNIDSRADDPSFENVIFLENIATGRGGAVNDDFYTSPTFVDVQFLHNHCTAKGGAVYNDMGCNAYFINVLFADNTAQRGTALVSDGTSNSRLVYTTMVGNSSNDIGASLYQGTYTSPQADGQPVKGNEPHLYASVVLGNTSAASPSSIDSWNDSSLSWDDDSTVEETDGTLTTTDYLDEDFVSLDASAGWDPDRDTSGELSTWLALFDEDDESDRTFSIPPYQAIPTGSNSNSIIYVKSDVSGGNNGTSWANAYRTLTAALNEASGSSGQEIWVAAGTYYPTTGTDRTQTFTMKKGVAVYGGFQGTETLLSQRNASTYSTILSGDIGTADDPTDNSYHVLYGASGATIDGFVIQDGYADGELYHGRGGGMLIYVEKATAANGEGASPIISNCTFQENYAIEGGAIAGYNYSSPTISNTDFSNNSAERGGAILFRVGGDPTISSSNFTGNSATDRGGAVFVDYGTNPVFTGNTFTTNSSGGNGGAIYADDKASQLGSTTLRFTSDQFTGNTAGMRGGAFAVYNNNTSVVGVNLTLTDNTAVTSGGGVAVDQSQDDLPIDTYKAWECTGCTTSGNTPASLYTTPDYVDYGYNYPDEPEMQIKRGLYELADGSGSYAFGSVAVGEGSTKVFTIKNIGEADLTLPGSPAVVISGTNADDFAVTQQPASTIAEHRTSEVVIQFSPTATGSRTATVTVASDAGDTEHTFTVTGIATEATSNGSIVPIIMLLLL
ncbi:MAG: choice-of-anchor D domain-containing protein [Candidatus Electrothrix communis]|nr:MAG: choice-of-anchor D domain-containing protein [Candidatus Electrothrix communis]